MQTRQAERLVLSVPDIDKDHSVLIAQEDELAVAVQAEAAHREILQRLTQLIQAYRDHFDCEEVMMRSNRFEGWERHCDEHLNLIEEMSWLHEEWRSGFLSDGNVLVLTVRHRTERHITGADKKFASYLHRG